MKDDYNKLRENIKIAIDKYHDDGCKYSISFNGVARVGDYPTAMLAKRKGFKIKKINNKT